MDDDYDYVSEYPDFQIEISQGSDLKIFNKDKLTFEPCRVMIDILGNFLVLDAYDETYIDLSRVSDIRKNYIYKDSTYAIDEKFKDLTFTVVYGDSIVYITYLHILCDNESLFNVWYKTIESIVVKPKLINPSLLYLILREYYRLLAIAQCLGKLSIETIAENISSPQTYNTLKKCLASMKIIQSENSEDIKISTFTASKFISLYRNMCPRPDIDECFKSMTTSKFSMFTKPELANFLKVYQNDQISNNLNKAEISKIERDTNLSSKDYISFNSLFIYLISDQSKIVEDSYYTTSHDLTKPLSHYFINSSHNTYLTGFQIYANSSTEIYRQVLLKGCRCIEIDCWDGSNLEPIVTHGYAMCSFVNFKDVVEAIKESAFQKSELPIIVSLENHCSSKNQTKMAQYFKDILGDLLLSEPLPEYPIAEESEFPPPIKLKKKILLKGKIQNILKKVSEETSSLGSTDNIPIPEEGPVHQSLSLEPPTIELGEEGDNETKIKEIVETIENLNLSDANDVIESENSLTSLINYAISSPVPNFSYDTDKNYIKVVSISETNGEKHINENSSNLLNFNKKSLTRIYPKGSRIDSSNYNPMTYWNIGCQLVALNLQTYDVPQQLNFSRFFENNCQGYVLKPNIFCDSKKKFNPISTILVEDVVPLTISIRIISCQFIYQKSLGITACIETFGLPKDQYSFKVKASKILDENILFEKNEEVLEKIMLPQNGYIRFSIVDENNICLYFRILPISGLKKGYRHIPMKDIYNNCSPLTTLFVFCDVKFYVPKNYEDFENFLANPIAEVSNIGSETSILSSSPTISIPDKSKYPSLNVPLQADIKRNVKETINLIKTKYSINNQITDKKRRTIFSFNRTLKRNDTLSIVSRPSNLTMALEITREKQKVALEELKMLQQIDLKNLSKSLTNDFIEEQKMIKNDQNLNKEQKERKCQANKQTFIEKCSKKRQELQLLQQKTLCAIIKINKEENDMITEYFKSEEKQDRTIES